MYCDEILKGPSFLAALAGPAQLQAKFQLKLYTCSTVSFQPQLTLTTARNAGPLLLGTHANSLYVPNRLHSRNIEYFPGASSLYSSLPVCARMNEYIKTFVSGLEAAQ